MVAIFTVSVKNKYSRGFHLQYTSQHLFPVRLQSFCLHGNSPGKKGFTAKQGSPSATTALLSCYTTIKKIRFIPLKQVGSSLHKQNGIAGMIKYRPPFSVPGKAQKALPLKKPGAVSSGASG